MKQFLRRLLRKPPSPPTGSKRVWRATERRPGGEWVDPAASASGEAPPRDAGPSTGGWITTSMDLLDGTDVVVPAAGGEGEPIDELASFYPRRRRD